MNFKEIRKFKPFMLKSLSELSNISQPTIT